MEAVDESQMPRPQKYTDTFILTKNLFQMVSMVFNIVSGSDANITTPCEMEIFNFLWLIWDHYIPLAPT